MKLIFCLLISFACCTMGCTNAQNVQPIKKEGIFSPVAVIELFTSQGCSSCPPADALLTQTIATAKEKGQNIYALSFHVDYWNRLGWTDPFSEHAYSQRQADYVSSLKLNGAYTPQMVVNGKAEFVGSDESALNRNLQMALNGKAKVGFKTLEATNEKGSISLKYSLDGDFSNTTINAALVSLKEVTSVKRGENGGRTLVNENVVRNFITQNAQTSGVITLDAAAIKDKNNFSIIVFIQNKNTLEITGASTAAITF
ncbi:MAG: DUF1223 domain-containing protein [Chitinophagaceae bacterium]